jgi:sugar phosphate isomerase/epimerase
MRQYALGLSEFTTWPWAFEKDVAAYHRHRLEAIEVTEFKLDQARIGKQLSSIAASGLRVASVQAKIHGIFATKLQPEPDDPEARVVKICDSIDTIAPHVPHETPFVIITGAPPRGDIAHCADIVVKSLQKIAAFAADRKMRIALEALNPALMNVDSAIFTLSDALAIVEEVGAGNCGLCVDTWNIWQERDLERTIHRAGKRISLVQVSDYRRPRALYDRLIPGDGEIPLATIVAALLAAGYAGPWIVEILSSESLPDSLWKRDLDEVIDGCIRGFDRVWGKLAA